MPDLTLLDSHHFVIKGQTLTEGIACSFCICSGLQSNNWPAPWPYDQTKNRNLINLFFITDRPCAAAGGECRLTREEDFCDEQDGLFLPYLCAGNRNRKCCIPQAKGTVVFRSLSKYDKYSNITLNICFFI